MRERFWETPGPQQLLHQVKGALLRGDSVVFRQPEGAPDMVEPLAAELPPQQPCYHIDDSPTHVHRSPEAVLCETLGLAGHSPHSAPCAPAHAEPVAIIHGAIDGRLKAWVRLVRRHHHATRDTPGTARLLLLAPAATAIAQDELGNAALVEWRDVVGRLDMHLYVAWLWRTRVMSLLERELCIAQTRELAGVCPEIAERLASAGTAGAFKPDAVLAAFCRDRGWCSQTKPTWANGSEDRRDGVRVVHAALAAACGDERDISRRLWQAQSEVLFPVVESIRFELAKTYQHLLRHVPDHENGGCFKPLDVDVGPLAYNLMGMPQVCQSHRDLARVIKDIRNAIAHRKPVSQALALQANLVRVVDDGYQLSR